MACNGFFSVDFAFFPYGVFLFSFGEIVRMLYNIFLFRYKIEGGLYLFMTKI